MSEPERVSDMTNSTIRTSSIVVKELLVGLTTSLSRTLRELLVVLSGQEVSRVPPLVVKGWLAWNATSVVSWDIVRRNCPEKEDRSEAPGKSKTPQANSWGNGDFPNHV